MYDEDERIIELAMQLPRKPAWMIKEEIGSQRSVRRIQEIIHEHLGKRPPREVLLKRDILRDRIVASMEEAGLLKNYCTVCERWFGTPLYIQELRQDNAIESLTFVCRNCAGPGAR